MIDLLLVPAALVVVLVMLHSWFGLGIQIGTSSSPISPSPSSPPWAVPSAWGTSTGNSDTR